MKPDELLRRADAEDAQGLEALERGEQEQAVARFKRAEALRDAAHALTTDESAANLRDVTSAQLQRRGAAIARGRAAKSKDPLWRAIVASEWRSQERYSRDRLRVSPSTLQGYRRGTYPCPRKVAEQVAKDLGIPLSYWPRGIVD